MFVFRVTFVGEEMVADVIADDKTEAAKVAILTPYSGKTPHQMGWRVDEVIRLTDELKNGYFLGWKKVVWRFGLKK